MKTFYKALFTLIIAAACHTSTNAQAFWGVYGGMNTANLKLSDWKTPVDPFDQQPKITGIRRLTFGVICELPLSDYLFLQPELAFTQKGGILKIDSGYSDITGGGTLTYQTVNNLDLNYLQVPLLLKVRFQINNPQPLYPREGSGRPLFVELYAGPVFNYLISPSAKYSQTINEQNTLTNIDTSYKIKTTGTQKGLKSMDFSAALGANIKWRVNKKTYLYLDLRYSMNFMNINNTMLVYEYMDKDNIKKNTPTLKNSGNLAVTFGINTTFTKRRYWDRQRMNNRRF